MAAHERVFNSSSFASSILLQNLATVLPTKANFKIYHLSTPPTRTSAIYSAPPGALPDRTYCESHFLAASIAALVKGRVEDKEVLVYAVEILIYSTAHDTTFFVSKADSTGYLHLLGLPNGTPSPIRDITATFLQYLVESHQRQNVRSTISLFARAQDQYLFPGSIEYSGKHVLDDRGLVKWWCRVLDPLIGNSMASIEKQQSQWEKVKGYLIVPGLDSYETLSYVPKRSTTNMSWTIGHPLLEISRHSEDVPPRCLIPHYPDDPKARFLDELDDEVSKGGNTSGDQWKSVKTIDQFWDMMAFRQECSAGRMVGFIWIVFTPRAQHQPTKSVLGDSQNTAISLSSQAWEDYSQSSALSLSSPVTSFTASSQTRPPGSPLKESIDDVPTDSLQSARASSRVPKRKNKLTGRIVPRQPRIKKENKNYLLERPESTPYYLWQPKGRGQVVVEETDYKRVTELLLRLDFANFELASSSSIRWINEVRTGAWGSMGDAWGRTVTGTKVLETREPAGTTGVTTLNLGLMRKKRKDAPAGQQALNSTVASPTPTINVLSTNMIRKKPKI
jgi:regulator of Ty1 transposition protein 109